MKRWKQSAVLTMIVGASFVLLVTVLPQFASGIGLGALANRLTATSSCSGSSGSSGSSTAAALAANSSSGSSSSTCPPPDGTVTGTVTVTGAPKNFEPAYTGAGACPVPLPTAGMCADPIYALANDGSYSLSLPAGKWTVVGFYEINALGGAFIGTSRVVDVPGGGTLIRNLTVPYVPPATLKGTVKVTQVPRGIQLENLQVLLCPSYAPYTGGYSSSIACVSDYLPEPSGGNVSQYQITGLPPGQWTAYPGYCSEFGCATNANAGTPVSLTPNGTTVADLVTPFLMPDEGIVTGTISVIGAPAGFDDPIGVTACQVGTENCESFQTYEGSSYTVLLANGKWTLTPFYQVPPFYNNISGQPVTVKIVGGKTKAANLTVAYQKLGTAAGTINVTGLPARTVVKDYTVMACPAATPWTGGIEPTGCINEYSGPAGYGYEGSNANGLNKFTHAAMAPAAAGKPPYNVFQLSTLTGGAWLLYPGYTTAYETYTKPFGTPVQITPGKTSLRTLNVTYQTPTVGVVQGTVDAIGAPQNDFQTGAQACSAPPSGSTCANEQDSYSQENGAYQLELAPGAWWVSGFVQVYGDGPGEQQSSSAPHEVTVTAGKSVVENFVVTVGS